MTKNKSFKFSFFNSSWIGIIITAVAIGIASQHIPGLLSYTEKLANRAGKIIEQRISVDHVQDVLLKENVGSDKPISSFYIERTDYSLAYDAQHRNPAWVYEH